MYLRYLIHWVEKYKSNKNKYANKIDSSKVMKYLDVQAYI